MLLSFSMMAKSHSSTKIKKVDISRNSLSVKKTVKAKSRSCECFIYITTCGVKGIACGSTSSELLQDILNAEGAFC